MCEYSNIDNLLRYNFWENYNDIRNICISNICMNKFNMCLFLFIMKCYSDWVFFCSILFFCLGYFGDCICFGCVFVKLF